MPFQSTVGDYQTVATLETFGFLPPMTQDEIYDQIAYIIAQGWSPVIEHVQPSGSMQTYWSYWKLPFFGEKDLNLVVSELEACIEHILTIMFVSLDMTHIHKVKVLAL